MLARHRVLGSLFCVLICGCVSRPKYKNDLGALQLQLDDTSSQLATTSATLEETKKSLAATQAELAQRTQEVADKTTQLAQLSKDLNELRNASDSAIAAKRAELAKLQAELKSATEEQQRLAAEAAKKQRELAESLKATQSELKELRAQRARNEKRLAEFRALQQQLKEMITAGDLTVYQRRGRIMVALPSSVLFASGSADLSGAGKRAIARVAKVLKDVKGRRFLVAGHTDNVPIKTRRFPDNWALSTARASDVTRFLIANGMSGDSLAAAGYGEFDPVAKNTTAAGRKANRRIEIILVPNLENLDLTP